MAEHLSPNFTLEELIKSDTAKAKGISNVPSEIHKRTLKHTCVYFLEPLRTLLNTKYKVYGGSRVKYVAVKITSGYRGPALNKAVGGAKTSGHCLGEAADLEAVIVFENGAKAVLPYTNLYSDIKEWVKLDKLSVDQCIQERSGNSVWVHASYSAWGSARNREQFLIYNGKNYKLDCVLK